MNKDYKVIKTEDGSRTIYSPLYDEACHSTTGAASETQLHYIDGCEVLERDNPTILEVGFGTGLGFIETSKYVKGFFHFISLEIDKQMIEIAKEQYPILKNLKNEGEVLSLSTNAFKLDILVGDARLTLENYTKSNKLAFNCIYQDAFSPKRNAILWTTEWFKLLYNNSSEDCIMSTYSSSSSIRKSMLAAGWSLYEGVRFGPKRSSTRAKKSGDTSKEILEKLERSPAIEITDKNAKEYKL